MPKAICAPWAKVFSSNEGSAILICVSSDPRSPAAASSSVRPRSGNATTLSVASGSGRWSRRVKGVGRCCSWPVRRPRTLRKRKIRNPAIRAKIRISMKTKPSPITHSPYWYFRRYRRTMPGRSPWAHYMRDRLQQPSTKGNGAQSETRVVFLFDIGGRRGIGKEKPCP